VLDGSPPQVVHHDTLRALPACSCQPQLQWSQQMHEPLMLLAAVCKTTKRHAILNSRGHKTRDTAQTYS
jgi:hypothetical protein